MNQHIYISPSTRVHALSTNMYLSTHLPVSMNLSMNVNLWTTTYISIHLPVSTIYLRICIYLLILPCARMYLWVCIYLPICIYLLIWPCPLSIYEIYLRIFICLLIPRVHELIYEYVSIYEFNLWICIYLPICIYLCIHPFLPFIYENVYIYECISIYPFTRVGSCSAPPVALLEILKSQLAAQFTAGKKFWVHVSSHVYLFIH